MAHVTVSRHHRIRNISEEVGGDIVRGVGRRGQTVVGLDFFREREERV